MAANDARIKMTIRPEKALYEMLRDYCHEARTSHNAVVLRALKLYLTGERLREIRCPRRS